MDYYTKEQRKEYNKRWRQENKDHINAYRREYYMKHKFDAEFIDKIYATNKRWREKNKKRKALEGKI